MFTAPQALAVAPPQVPLGADPTDGEVAVAVRYNHTVKASPAATDALIRSASVYEMQLVSKVAWPAVHIGGAVVPGGVPPWAAILIAATAANTAATAANTAATAANTAATAANTAATAANTVAVNGLRNDVNVLLNRTSAVRASALRRNSKAKDLKHRLSRVPHPDTGAMPPTAGFPRDITALRRMTAAAVNALSAFYGLPTAQVGLVKRRQQLADALGCEG